MTEQPFVGALEPGAKLEKYEVGEQIAAGGMAIVYKAYDPSLDRSVAIKQIAPHLAQDERFVERFRNEAQILARISGTQANIVNVYELIERDGQLFLVMEHVEGTTLRTMMDRGPVPLQTGLGILLSAALGLKAMHVSGIVHRDLTPSNLMMAKDGALKIADFGLIGHSGGRTSLPMGTTKYMAPEMFTGAPVDPRADIYSLGFVAYEMLIGPEKFAEVFRDVLRDERAQQVRWMHWHSNSSLKVPSLKDIQPGIPPLVSKIVERMMLKEASRRFGSMDQIIRWLRRIFVMHVQGKSVSVTDSESLEKEMEADVAGATGLVARPAQQGGAATAQVPAVEKTAPLPQPKWTWQRAALWTAVIAGPLIAASIALLVWQHYRAVGIERRAGEAVRSADRLYKAGDWSAAADAYEEVIRAFPQTATYAGFKAEMAQAEGALEKKEWDRAGQLVDTAAQQGAGSDWEGDFRRRLRMRMDIEQQTRQAEAAERAGDFEAARAILEDLQARYGGFGLDLSDRIGELQDKKDMKEYREWLGKAKDSWGKQSLDAALEYLRKARRVRETPEVAKLIEEVTNDRKIREWYRQAEGLVADEKYEEAAELYARILAIRPSDKIQKKMNNAKATSLALQAKSLLESGLANQAIAMLPKILELDPQHTWAQVQMRKLGLKTQLDGYIRAADEAMGEERWKDAVKSTGLALGLDAADDKTRERLEEQLAEARFQAAVADAGDAIAQKQWDKAEIEIAKARSARPEAPEVETLEQNLDRDRRYYRHLDTAKELMSQSAFGKAKDELKLAQEIDDTQEARELIVECDYRIFLGKGKYYLSQQGGAQQALAWFKLAQDKRDTVEVQALIKEAERRIMEEAEGNR